MRLASAAALLLALVGVALFVIAATSGGVHVALVVFVPVLYGSSPWLIGGVLALIGAFVVGFFSAFEAAAPPSRTVPGPRDARSEPSSEWGGFVLIGPVPVVFGSGGLRPPTWLRYVFAGVVVLFLVAVTLALLFR